MKLLSTCLLGLALTAGSALAQSGLPLIVEPWKEDANLEISAAVEEYLRGGTDSGAPYDLRRSVAQGRYRFDAEGPRLTGPAFGFDFRFMKFDTPDPRVPSRLTDQVVGAAFPRVTEWDGWTLSAFGGVGFAGDQPYSNSDGWYGKGGVVARKRLGRGSSWLLSLTYDGNRAIFPDIPLPGVSYQGSLGPKLRFLIGFPFLGATWKPVERLELEVRGFPPIFVEAEARYRLSDEVSIFGLFDSRSEAYPSQALSPNRRLFWQQNIVEAGLRWDPKPWLRVTLAAGYAWDRKLRTGWDVRDLVTRVEFSDEPYGFLRLTFRF